MYSKVKAAVVGSINMDMILSMEKVPEVGENLLGTTYGYACGGKGANQATALAKLGAATKMIGKVADDENGNALVENLKANAIDASGVSLARSVGSAPKNCTPPTIKPTMAPFAVAPLQNKANRTSGPKVAPNPAQA